MVLLDSPRRRYLYLGLALRLVLILFGLYQDAHLAVPYTDIDYSVFQDGARHLVHGCPLHAAVPPHMEPMETLNEFLEPPLAPVHGCAQGWLALGARYILQHEDILTARSRGRQAAEIARKDLGEEATLSLIEPNIVETTLLPVSLAILKPILKPLAAMGNPYARPTYRYTPLLAVLMAPGAWIGGAFEKVWGKLLFVAADILAALLMWDLARFRRPAAKRQPTSTSRLPLVGDVTHAVGILWLLNPFPAQIATRGSCEALVVSLVLAFASAAVRIVDGEASFEAGLAASEDRPEQASNDINDPPAQVDNNAAKPAEGKPTPQSTAPPPPGLGLLPSLPLPLLAAPVLLALAAHLKLYPIIYGLPLLASLLPHSRRRWLDALGFSASASYAFLGLSGFAWLVWGQPYLQESLLYHVGRVDHRHNFSPYFFPLYLLHTPAQDGWLPALAGGGVWAGEAASRLGAFLPQLAVVAWIGVRVGKKDLIAAMASQTMAFVVWNKVSTSQYFIWYIAFLPILLPSLRFSSPLVGWASLLVWAATQALWLSQAYLLEFEGQDVFVRVWAAGLVYVVGNAWVLERCLDAWARGRRDAREQEQEQREGEKAVAGKEVDGEKAVTAAEASASSRPASE